MATDGNGDLPVPDLRTIEELYQQTLNGRGGPIASISIQAINFGLNNDMIQQVQNSCQFHGLLGDDANKHLDKFLHVTQSIKVNKFDRLPRNSINTFEQMAKMFLGKYFPPSMVTKLRNKITNFRQRLDESLFKAWEGYKLSIDRCPNHNMLPVTQIDTFYNGLTLRHRDTINATAAQRSESSSSITSSSDPKIIALKAKMAKINKNLMKFFRLTNKSKQLLLAVKLLVVLILTMIVQPPLTKPRTYMLREPIKVLILTNLKMNTASSSGSRTLPSNTITNPKEDLKGVTTRSGNAYQGPMIPTTSCSLPQVVELKIQLPNSEPIVAPVAEPVVTPVSAPKPNPKPSIPYPSRLHDQKLRDKANDQKEKIFHIFKDLDFNISFVDALNLMPKFGPTIKNLLTNKDKLFELARTSLNEHCLAVLLKKLPEKLRDPNKFLIPCDFLRMDECLALANLGASINLMPLSVWNKLSLPGLAPTLMTLKLENRSISRPIGVAEDVFVKVGKFHFSTDFIVVDFDANSRVPLILGRSFLKTERALIDVYAGELTLRVNNEAVTFNLDQTSRYSDNYNDMTANRIDVIDMACEEYCQEVLGFSDVIASVNPTPYYDPIISTSSPTLTPFGDSDFLLEEVNAFLALEDDPTSREVRLWSTNGSNNGLNDGSNNGLRIRDRSFNLDNRRLDVFGAFIISRRHRVLLKVKKWVLVSV
nr:reverse transcriptase domain-containing protein [Tanacetum cinerariifolium]